MLNKHDGQRGISCECGLQAIEVLQRLREDPDAEADVVSYSSAIMACERGSRCEEALTLFDDMQRASLQPTAYIYMVR